MKQNQSIFAYDKEGYDIVLGDHVVYRRHLYRVQKLNWSSDPSDGYKESVHLELIHLRTLKIVIVEDCKVMVVD
jgi:hypothetical protein